MAGTVRIGVVAAMIVTALALVPGAAGGLQAVTCDGTPATIVGSEGDDRIIGTEGNDVIVGLGGNDIIRGLGGDDLICGDNGRDRLFGGRGKDRLFGGKKNDILKGDAGADMLFGNQGIDRLFGGGGGDRLEGGSGTRDKLFGKGGTDTCIDPQPTTIYDTCEIGVPGGPQIGSAIALTGRETAASITVHNLVDPAQPLPFNEPDAGNRLVAVLVSMRSTVGNFSECAGNVFELVDSTGVSHEPAFSSTTAGPDLPCFYVRQGDVRAGWVTFEIPNAATVSRLEAALDAGFSDDVGEWNLRTGSARPLNQQVLPATTAIGSPQALSGFNDVQLRVTVTQWADPATPAGPFDQPAAGNRLIAAEILYENTGAVQYSGSLTGGIAAITADGRIIDTDISDITNGPRLGFNVTINPGGSERGWVVFELPNGLDVVKLNVALSFLADDQKEWRIP